MDQSRKTGAVRALRMAFYGCATGFLAFHLGHLAVTAPMADQTDDVALRAGMSSQKLKSYARSPFRIFYASDPLAQIFFKYGPVPDMLQRDIFSMDVPHAETWQSDRLGYGSGADKFTGGLSGRVMPCAVIMPDRTLTMDNVKAAFSGLTDKFSLRMPGELADYIRLIALHELEHCDHLNRNYDPVLNEYLADRRALDFYLSEGGKPAVVEAWVRGRIINSFETAVFGDAQEKQQHAYYAGTALYDRYILGHDVTASAADLERSKAAHRDVQQFLFKVAHGRGELVGAKSTSAALGGFIDSILKDPSIAVPPEMKPVMALYRDSIAFFMPGKLPGALPAAPAPVIGRRPAI